MRIDLTNECEEEKINYDMKGLLGNLKKRRREKHVEKNVKKRRG